ncbi:hypothetical protein K501DRAFT_335333 [Backusella circina FSU 941]|nr:hypothetical protein K501DRAFT_335333 [Backusella circina FSU 941]
MSINNLPHILIRKCEERKGIRITEKYLETWCSQRQLSNDMESEYAALLPDVLNTELAQTSTPVISDEISKAPFNTFPPGNFRRGVVLEIVDTDDISNSALSILENLTSTTHVRRGVVTNEDQTEIQRGTLHWILSDGATHIHAMENETIPELSLTTPFGCKLLIKNCQVRRGMLLLDRRSVTVLGGETPAAYNNNMIEELTTRLKARLGIGSDTRLSRNTTPNTLPSNTLDGSTLVNTRSSTTAIDLDEEYDDMDMNDEMFDALDSIEADALRNNSGQNDMNDYMDEYMDDDWDVDMLEKVLPVSIPPTNATVSNNNNNNNNNNESSSSSSSRHFKRPVIIDCDDPGEGTSKPPSTKKRQKITSVRADQLDNIMWGEGDNDDILDLDDINNEVIEENKNERWSLDRLNNILRKMEKDEPVGSLPDTVIVSGTIKRLGQLRLTNKQGFYLVGYLKNPMNEQDDRLRILFRNAIVTKLLHGTTYTELMEKSASPEGKQAVLKETIGPLQTMLRTKEADIEVDLSLCERDKESVLMPLVINYTTLK